MVGLFSVLPPGYIPSLPCPCVISVSFRLSYIHVYWDREIPLTQACV